MLLRDTMRLIVLHIIGLILLDSMPLTNPYRRGSRLIFWVELMRLMRVMYVLSGLYLSGCMASGVQVKPEQLSNFKKGETTKQQVISALGNPTARSVTADGSEMLIYNYAAYQARPASFIPLIGPLVGGADVQTSMVWFQFGTDGKLINYTAQNSATGSANNFAAPSTPQTTNQPSKATP